MKCLNYLVLMGILITTMTICGLASEEKILFDYRDSAADSAFNQAFADSNQMESLLAFPAALAIPRLEYFMMHARSYPEHSRKAIELIPKVTGWMEYYQWILAEAYKDANPPPGAKTVFLDTEENTAWFDRVETARAKMNEIFTHLIYISDPGAVSLIGRYLNDQGPQMGRGDVAVSSVENAVWHTIGDYFKRQTGKRPDMLPDQWRAWWKANKANYPVLPEQPRKPWFPPPATPKPATPPPRTPDIVGDYVHKHMPEMVAQREAERKMQASMATPPPATPVPQIPHLRTEVEARPQRWLVAGICTLLAAAAAYFILRPRR